MSEAPALLIFKDNIELIFRLSDEDAGKMLKAVCVYAKEKTQPLNLSEKAEMCFLVLKRDLERNEQKYEDKRRKNKEEYERRRAEKEKQQKQSEVAKKKGKPPDNKNSKEKQTAGKKARERPKQSNLTQEQKDFLKEFKVCFPNKEINCDVSIYKSVDFVKLIQAIKESPQFLMNEEKNKAFDLKWFLENSDKIIAGTYKKFDDERKEELLKSRAGQTYTVEELEKLSGKSG